MKHFLIALLISLLTGLIMPGSALAGPLSTPTRVVSGSTAVTAPGPSSDWRADVSAHARRMIEAGFFPGMQIAVTRGDKVAYVGSFGVADVNTGRRVNDQTRFYIASTTKALTATAVVLEAARGNLQLDAPLTRYLPDLHFKAPLQADAVTIRDLLSMTDGISDCVPVVLRTAFTGVFTPTGLVRLMRHCGPSDAGREFAYRNVPYNLLGMVLAPQAGDGWKAVIRTDVLEPLGMRETSARLSTLDPDQIAMPHQASSSGFQRIRLAKADANLHAAGGHFSTAADLARFIAVHAAGGRLDGRQIFPADVIASTHAQHASQDRDFGPYHRFGWGLGWDLGTYEGRTIVHRFGAFAGYRSHASFMPDTQTGVVVLVNGVAAPFAADQMANYIYDRVDGDRALAEARYQTSLEQLEQRQAKFATRIAEHEAVQRERNRHALPHPLTAYTGRYVNAQIGTMVWQLAEDGLEVSMGLAQSAGEIYDATNNQLRVELIGSGQTVQFRFPIGGGPASEVEYGGYSFQREARAIP